jgi:hypothetical protein
MSDRALYCYDYVNQPYPRVRDVILANPHHVFRHATAAAAAHGAALHIRFGGVDIGKDVAISIAGIEHDHAYDRPATKVLLEWHAENNARMFPVMKATLMIFALSATETQLELRGVYEPPMGRLGEVLDAIAGHRLAQASVSRFIQEVAGWLREDLAALPPAAEATPASQPGTTADLEC